MNRRDFIAGAVGGFIVGAGVGYSIGRRKSAEPAPAESQSGGLAPDRRVAPPGAGDATGSAS
jgi:hypothetical protein